MLLIFYYDQFREVIAAGHTQAILFFIASFVLVFSLSYVFVRTLFFVFPTIPLPILVFLFISVCLIFTVALTGIYFDFLVNPDYISQMQHNFASQLYPKYNFVQMHQEHNYVPQELHKIHVEKLDVSEIAACAVLALCIVFFINY